MIPVPVYDQYVASLLCGNRVECERIVRELLAKEVDPREVCVDLFQRSLYEVGDRWERHQVSVAVEHLATAITETLLCIVEPKMLGTDRVGKSAIVSSGANEYHQIGAKIVADILELHGWQSYFLGANVPTTDLMDLIDATKPDLVALSQTVAHNIHLVRDTLGRISTIYPGTPVLIGGQAFQSTGQEIARQYPSVRWVPSLAELEGILGRGSVNE